VRRTPETRLKKMLAIFDLVKNYADAGKITEIRWNSTDLGSWESVQPGWRVLNGRIRFRFSTPDRAHQYWVASIKPTPWGVRVLLTDLVAPVPGVFDISWKESVPEFVASPELWDTVRHWLASRFPCHRIVTAGKRSCLAHTLSGKFLRVVFRHGQGTRYLIAADEDVGDEIHKALGQALVWLSWLFAGKKPNRPPEVDILIPAGTGAPLVHRSRLLNSGRIKVHVWEYSPGFEVRKASSQDPPVEDRDFRWPVLGPFRWSPQLEKILNLAPALIRRYPRFQDYDSLRLWGLEFARVMGPERDRVCFGVGTQRTDLTEDNFPTLSSLVDEILYFRRPDSPDIRHPYYRLQAERWLEALVLEDVAQLFPEMAPESVYSQIPVYLGKDPGRIDILGADRSGTLIVIELKVAPDSDLPLQALDYWGRVIQHNDNGDFEHRGYFSEVRLNRNRPRIYLVSPVFSFHDTTENLLRFLDPELEVWKVSINEDWRTGVKVVRRLRYRCGEPG